MFSKIMQRHKNIFSKIINDHWEQFKAEHPKYDIPQYNKPIEKALNCGEEQGGYTEYRCYECGLGMRRVAFSCKSCFCLSCGKVYTDNVVSQISMNLHAGMSYRHIVLTIPEQLRDYFFKNRFDGKLLSSFMRIGYECLENAVSKTVRTAVKIGCVVVVQTHGRNGSYNPHLHIIMSSGGVDEKSGKWRAMKWINYDMLHRKWQYYLLTFLREWDNGLKNLVDELWKKYPNGFVANVSKGEAPQKAKGLARYLAKYVASPPISVSRILKYDGQNVTYRYRDHKSGKEQIETVTAEVFVGRMVQHILPKGFQRIRYYGLQATKTFKKWQEVIKKAKLEKSNITGSYEVVPEKKYRQRYEEGCGRDPLICPHCGKEMSLWEIWHPKYGVIYSEKNGYRKRKKRLAG